MYFRYMYYSTCNSYMVLVTMLSKLNSFEHACCEEDSIYVAV